MGSICIDPEKRPKTRKDNFFVVEEFRSRGDWEHIERSKHSPSSRHLWVKLTYEGREVRMSSYSHTGRIAVILPAIGVLLKTWQGSLGDGKKLLSMLIRHHSDLGMDCWIAPISLPDPMIRQCLRSNVVVEAGRIVHFPKPTA